MEMPWEWSGPEGGQLWVQGLGRRGIVNRNPIDGFVVRESDVNFVGRDLQRPARCTLAQWRPIRSRASARP
jgi:hypothetical protein